MGCRSSTPQVGAAAGNNKESDKLSFLIRRRVDSIRRRSNRVGDAITMESTLSFKMLIKDPDHIIPTTITDIDANEEMNNSDKGNNVVVDAVLRAIEELMLAEEREYAAALQLSNDHNSGVSRHVNRQMSVPQSPSFRVYCTSLDSFDSCSSQDNDHDDAVKDKAKTKRGRCKSMDTASVMSSEEEEGSRKGKMEGQRGQITKKAVSNWKLGSPLGMKNLFVMSCYSCSPHNRDRFLSRG